MRKKTMAQFISDTVKAVMTACQKLSGKREVELIDNKINQLIEKKAELTGNKTAVVNVAANMPKNVVKKNNGMKVTSTELLINVAANVAVKDICRNIERKLNRNLKENNKDDMQMLFNHLHVFYSLKHVNSLPIVHGKNKDYDIDTYVALRTNSVMHDSTCHINFGK